MILIVKIIFIVIIVIRMLAFMNRMKLMIQNRILKEMKLFFIEYWNWKHIIGNLTSYSLGLSSLLFYYYIWHLSNGVTDVRIDHVYIQYPVLVLINCILLIALLIYTIYRSIEHQKEFLDVILHLKRYRKYSIYKSGIKKLQKLKLIKSTGGIFIDISLEVLTRYSDRLIQRGFDSGFRSSIYSFMILTISEGLVRFTVVIMAIYICEGTLRFL